jgi:hypothetical protein
MRIELLKKSPADDRLGTILSDGLRAGEQAWFTAIPAQLTTPAGRECWRWSAGVMTPPPPASPSVMERAEG